ncbi:group II intron reverse transcriptase/maturase [Salipaludibacillus aurantiacus]|uniref:RNA-directed DNA polymerase n=1 Tax=Salipaludibacillus aurantiacus TaxID=1601833 RepID=A0A1H9XBY7_9BACI|nr:group II intron reverse transcriptase/maturase [Salipaludibacillus aurantiacus]SES43397.1 group II intron reverse transcriptase/maturase [Salipaludibacillus aurantiacus]
MQRPQTISKDGCLQEGTLEAKSNAGGCSVLRGEKKSQGGEPSELMRKLVSRENLGHAFKRVKQKKGSAGIDGVTTNEIHSYFAEHHRSIVLSLKEGSYEPHPVKRVLIPKDNGSKRELGIPTVRDRVIQQALVQVITPYIDPHFSENSYGFRPGRSAHDAIMKAKSYHEEGYRYVVDIDLKQYFDTVNHDKLMYLVSQFVSDRTILKLIRKFLVSGVKIGDHVHPSEIGTPQGGNLSPLLSNIYLNELDKELERRGHRFIRYADDCNIYVKSSKAGERVLKSITTFLEDKLRLTVNKEKSAVGAPTKRKFLGFCLQSLPKGKSGIRPHIKAKHRLEKKVRGLLSRKRPGNVREIIKELNEVLRGWIAYYGISRMKKYIRETAQWVRRRIRQLIWKRWKKVKTRYRSLIKLKVPKDKAWEWANTRKGYWRISKSFILHRSITKEALQKAGLLNMDAFYKKMYEKHHSTH